MMRGPLANGLASDTVDMDNATFDIGDDGDDRTLMEDDDDDDGANPAALDTIMARDDTINNFILFVLFILFVFVYIYI